MFLSCRELRSVITLAVFFKYVHAVRKYLCTANCDPDLTVLLPNQSNQLGCLGVPPFGNPAKFA